MSPMLKGLPSVAGSGFHCRGGGVIARVIRPLSPRSKPRAVVAMDVPAADLTYQPDPLPTLGSLDEVHHGLTYDAPAIRAVEVQNPGEARRRMVMVDIDAPRRIGGRQWAILGGPVDVDGRPLLRP